VRRKGDSASLFRARQPDYVDLFSPLLRRDLGAERKTTMAFTVTSTSFKDGDYMPKDFILSADFGFGCAGGNKSPQLNGRARRRKRKASP
jgi:hypothetical protein